ncbi:MAG: immunoglobulin-like domain-containing protein, partial [Saprospiraceae bacterium]
VTYQKGATTVTLSATDASANVAVTCSFTVTVNDDENPVLTCPSNIVTTTDPGVCSAVVDYLDPTISDNCPCTMGGPGSLAGYTLLGTFGGHTYYKTNGTADFTTAQSNAVSAGGYLVVISSAAENTFVAAAVAAIGQETYIGLSDDASEGNPEWVDGSTPTSLGYSNYCSAPSAANNGGLDWVIMGANNCATGEWAFVNHTARPSIIEVNTVGTSLCPVMLSNGLASGSAFPTGINTVEWTGTDEAGRMGTCSFTVTVSDDESPMLADPMADCSSLDILGVDECLNAAVLFDATTLEASVANLYLDNCSPVTATLTSTLPDGGNSNCSWSFTYTYTISDGIPANDVTCTVLRSGSDKTIPVITRNGSATVEICQYETYTDAGATAMDNCAGNITGDISTNNPVNTAIPNTYTVTYDVMDPCTNAAIQVTRTVIVHPVPTANVTGNTLVCIGTSIALDGNPTGGSGIYSAHGWSQTGGTGSVSITNNNDGTADIQGLIAGTVTLEYTVTDDETCTGTAVYNITVIDCGGITFVNDKQPDDPCACNNDQTANGAQDGTFDETVSVTPTTNVETWTVVAITRLAGSGGLPTGIAVGNTLTYNAGGFHEITFQHVDDAGYAIIVEGPNATVGTPGNPAGGNAQYNLSNICQYPVIAFDPTLPDNVCLNSTPIPLTVSEANSFAGISTFTVNGNADTQFDPSAPLTPPGPYPVVANFTGTFVSNLSTDVNAPAFPGCMTNIMDEIGIYPGPSISCPAGPINLTTSSDDTGDCDVEQLLNHPDIGTMCATTLEIAFTNGAPVPPYLPVDGVVTPKGSDTYAFAAGRTIVTYTATDAANNTTSCSFTVNVVDDEDPTITCPGPITVKCASLVPAPNTALVTGSDNCVSITKQYLFTTLPYDVDCINRFKLTRYYQVTDGSGNTVSCSQVITVYDDTKPVFTFVPANTTVQCNSVPAVGNPTASDNCNGTVQITYNGQNKVNGSCTDSYVLTRQWTATDACGNTQTATHRITVIDTQKPAFVTVPANVTVQCDAIPAVASPTATDNCDASVAISYIGQTKANGACANAYTLTRRWVASDNCNNTVSISQRITVVDNGKPAITVPPNVTIACTDPVPAVGTATATDNCGGTVTIVYLGQSTMNATCPGNYQINRTWRATDVCGNSTAGTQTITVRDNSAPVFTSVPNNVTIQCHQSPPATGNPVATDNCGGPVSITYLGQTRTDGNCLYNYTLTRTWRATDLCGNSTTTAQVITVQDTQAPVFTNPPANLTVVCAPDCVPAPVTPNATDNCGTPTVTLQQTQSAGDCSTGYTVTRTWTATDQCGNPKVYVQTITVLPAPPFAPPSADRDQEQRTPHEVKLKTVSLTPNPTTDRVLIGLGDFAGETVVVSIYGELGQLIWERKVETVIDMVLPVNLREAGAPAGLYTVSVRGGGQVVSKRLVLME